MMAKILFAIVATDQLKKMQKNSIKIQILLFRNWSMPSAAAIAFELIS